MARIRAVKPELRTSDLVASWPIEARYFFVLLWGYLDDKGRGLDNTKTIAGDCFPHDDKITPNRVDSWLTMMAHGLLPGTEGPICRYEVRGRRYLHCRNWPEHQKPNRPTPSRLPACPTHEAAAGDFSDGLTEPLSESLHATSVPGAGEQGSRGDRSRGAAAARVSARDLKAAAAADLVASVIPDEHPADIRRRLAAIAAGLATDGTPDDVLEAALRRWTRHPNAGPRMLPSLVSDVLRERRGATTTRSTTDERIAALQALKTTPAPPLPPGRSA